MLLKDLQTLATKLATGTLFHVEKAGKAYSVDYSALAKAIIEEYADSTVGGSKQSVQAAIGALNSSLKRTYTYTANTEDEFVSSLLNDLRTLSAGNYVITAVRQSYYVCTVCVSVQSSNRCITLIIPQAGNSTYIISATYNNGTIDIKKIYDNKIIDALNNRFTHDPNGIPVSADTLNNGYYFGALNAETSPTGSVQWFNVYTDNGTTGTQTATVYNGLATYTRGRTENSWTNWILQPTRAEVAALDARVKALEGN